MDDDHSSKVRKSGLSEEIAGEIHSPVHNALVHLPPRRMEVGFVGSARLIKRGHWH